MSPPEPRPWLESLAAQLRALGLTEDGELLGASYWTTTATTAPGLLENFDYRFGATPTRYRVMAPQLIALGPVPKRAGKEAKR